MCGLKWKIKCTKCSLLSKPQLQNKMQELWFISKKAIIAKILHQVWFVIKISTINEDASSGSSSILDYPLFFMVGYWGFFGFIVNLQQIGMLKIMAYDLAVVIMQLFGKDAEK